MNVIYLLSVFENRNSEPDLARWGSWRNNVNLKNYIRFLCGDNSNNARLVNFTYIIKNIP